MNNPQHNICDPRRIEGCLSDSLGNDEREDFEAHLEVCPSCREALESSAAQPADWRQVRDFLSSDACLPLPRGEGRGEGAVAEIGCGKGTDPDATSLRMIHSAAAAGDSAEAESLQREAVDGVLTVLAPTDDPHMLGRLGPYEIAGVVGRGGMGVVLKALDPALNRYVAIKVLAPQLATSGAARQRFAREGRAAASVVHENVVAIHAVADGGALPYFVMPYLRGASLQKRLDGAGPLGVAEILRVAIQIAAGLSAAHAQGLVHRDIKPANILLEDGVERLKITDFGLARAADDASLTRTGVIAGTPQFMSPEQARGELVDSRSDLFSLGSVMYAMCTARPPFRSETSYGTLQRICDAQPRPIREINPEIPVWLAAFVGRLHEKNPDQRFQTAQEVAQLLEQCLAHLRQPDAVPLPQAAAALQEAAEAALNRSSTERCAAWHSASTPGQGRAVSKFLSLNPGYSAAFAIAGVVTLLIGLWLANRWWPGTESVSPHAAETAKSETTVKTDEPVAPAIELVPVVTQDSGTVAEIQKAIQSAPSSWDDDVALQIRQLQADISRLEHNLSPPTEPKESQHDK